MGIPFLLPIMFSMPRLTGPLLLILSAEASGEARGPTELLLHRFSGLPRVQSSARTIVGLSQNRMASAPVSTGSRMTNTAPSTSMSRLQRPSGPNPGTFNGRVGLPSRSNFGSPRVAQSRTFSPPAFSGRSFSSASPRVFSSPSFSQGRSFSAPSYSGRSSFGGSHGGWRFFWGISWRWRGRRIVEVEVGEVTAKPHALFPINYPDQVRTALRCSQSQFLKMIFNLS